MVGIELVKDETIKDRAPDLDSTNRIMEETKKVINEAKEILDVEDIIASILLVEDLRIQKN